MKNRIYSLLLLVSLLFSMAGCGLIKKLQHKDEPDVVLGSTQNMYQETFEYTTVQLDSMCTVDGLPKSLDEWIRRTFSDYETNEIVVRYMYIKEMNDNYELTYIVAPKGEMYVVSKRKVVTE